MARQLSAGQRAAARAVQVRRGELDLTQKQLADTTDVSEATIQNLEAGRSWPRTGTLAKLERLGLGWPAGYLADLAAKVDDEQAERGESREEAVARLQAYEQTLQSELDRTRSELDQLKDDDREPVGRYRHRG